MLWRFLTTIVISGLMFPSIGHACGDPGYLIAFNALGDDGAVSAAPPAASGTIVAGAPQTVYEGGWGSAKSLFIFRTECLREAVKKPPAAMLPFGVHAAFVEAPRGAIVEPTRAPSQCSAPMVLVGFTRVKDSERNGAYSRAVVASNLPRLHGFVPLFNGRPAQVLAGEWPAGYTVSVSTWPCKAAYDAFYLGDDYVATIKPIRRGAGDYVIVGFAPEHGSKLREADAARDVAR